MQVGKEHHRSSVEKPGVHWLSGKLQDGKALLQGQAQCGKSH